MKKLYLIYAKELKRVKIGFSKKPENRLKQLQTGSPVQLELFAFTSAHFKEQSESQLHDKYKAKRVKGEWFQLENLDYIELLEQWDFDPGIHYEQRTREKISVDDIAYISFSSQSLCKVQVVDISFDKSHITVKIKNQIGVASALIGGIHSLYADEVRKDPLDALINRVTS